MHGSREVVAAYWAAAEARDWDAFGALLADDVVYRGPQTREQVRGREAYVRFNVEGFPYDWHLAVQQIVAEGLHAASWIEFTGPEGTQPGLCFFDLADDGGITRITDFWPDPASPISGLIPIRFQPAALIWSNATSRQQAAGRRGQRSSPAPLCGESARHAIIGYHRRYR
jgi:hypothetical protein